MRQRDHDRAAELVPHTDALADASDAEQPPCRKAADGDDQPRLDQAQLFVAPTLAQLLLDRSSAFGHRVRRRVGRDSSASRRRSRRSSRTRPRRARAIGAASCRLARATAVARTPRRCPAPVRRGTPAVPRQVRAPGATRAGTPPRRRHGRSTGRASARRATGSVTRLRARGRTSVRCEGSRLPSSCASDTGSKTRLNTGQRDPSLQAPLFPARERLAGLGSATEDDQFRRNPPGFGDEPCALGLLEMAVEEARVNSVEALV